MTGQVIFFAGIILLLLSLFYKGFIFRPRQIKLREEAEKTPGGLDSWRLQYRKKVIYIWVVQMACILMAISGLLLDD